MTTISHDDLARLQVVILDIASYFDEFCRTHDITYYLMGGTALGAMRHKGFIPWDDDYDVFMDPVNYQKLLATAGQNLDQNRFYLQRENTEEWPLYFSKLRLNDTVFLEIDTIGRDMHLGIYIDIMCLNHAFSSRLPRYLQFLAARFLSTVALAKRGYKTPSRMKRLALACAGVLGTKWLTRRALNFVRSQNAKKTDLVGHFFGRAPFAATSFPTAYLGEPRYVQFETMELPVPNNVESYLTCRFGPDYMEPPSQKVRDQYPSHAVKVDFGPYRS